MDALAGFQGPWYYSSFSALDRYFRRPEQEIIHVTVRGDIVALARAVPGLEFPGLANADAAAWDGNRRVYFQVIDADEKPRRQTFRPLNLLYDPHADRYLDPYDDYPALRAPVLETTGEPYDPLLRLLDAAVAVSRYPHEVTRADLEPVRHFPDLPKEAQRTVLTLVLTGPSPWRGLDLLERSGFVGAYWGELAGLRDTSHSKEQHPEGDVWTHSLETFRYRLSTDLTLTLALLLHDAGKPLAAPEGARRFDGHAEIGARTAQRFLRRLGYPEPIVEDVGWLVVKHMFPGALHRLPTFRTERLMAHRLFPALLELYRCDLESAYRGPDGYYRACKIYRDYLRNSANPYRDAEGRKLLRLPAV